MICPGPCNEAHRRALARGGEIPDDLEPSAGQPVWCRPCQGRILAAIESLPGLAAGLFQMGHRTGQIAHSGDVNGGRSATKVNAPTVSPVWEAIDEILTWSVRVQRELQEHLRQPISPRWVSGTTEGAAHRLRTATAYLTAYGTALLCAPWAEELWDVVRLAKRAQRAAGLDPHTERLTVACSSCEKPRLTREDGSDLVVCRGCGAVTTLAAQSV